MQMSEDEWNLTGTCKRVDLAELNSTCRDFEDGKLGIFHINIRSINHNFSMLIAYLQKINFNFQVLILTETWLSNCDTDAFNLPRYKTFTTESEGKRGGIRAYVHDSIVVHHNNVKHGKSFQSLNLTLDVPSSGKVFLHAIYRSPSGSSLTFNDEFELAYLNEPNRRANRSIFIGDFNLDLFKNNDAQVRRFTNIMNSLNCAPFITEATRDPPDSDSCSLIDHIWSNILYPSNSCVLDASITDHFPIITFFSIPMRNHDRITKKFRDFSQNNLNTFLLEAPEFSQILNNLRSDNLHTTITNFTAWLGDIVNKYFPIRQKVISIKSIESPWVTSSIKKCIDKKHRLYRLFKLGVIDRGYFNHYKNKLQTLLRFSKRNYFNNRFMAVTNNIRNTWKIINNVLNRTKQTIIDQLNVNDTHYTDKQDICNALISYFVSTAINTRSLNSTSVNENNCLEFVPAIRESAFFRPCTRNEVFNILSDLKNNANLHLPTKFLKLLGPYICSFWP